MKPLPREVTLDDLPRPVGYSLLVLALVLLGWSLVTGYRIHAATMERDERVTVYRFELCGPAGCRHYPGQRAGWYYVTEDELRRYYAAAVFCGCPDAELPFVPAWVEDCDIDLSRRCWVRPLNGVLEAIELPRFAVECLEVHIDPPNWLLGCACPDGVEDCPPWIPLDEEGR